MDVCFGYGRVRKRRSNWLSKAIHADLRLRCHRTKMESIEPMWTAQVLERGIGSRSTEPVHSLTQLHAFNRWASTAHRRSSNQADFSGRPKNFKRHRFEVW